MKFGKELKDSSVRGWEEYYMSYKRLKRVIKKLIVQIKEKKEKNREENNSPPTESESSSDEESSEKPSGGASSLLLGDRLDAENFALNEEKLAKREKKSRREEGENEQENAGNPTQPDEAAAESASKQQQQQRRRLNWNSVLISDDARQQFFHLFDEDLDKINSFFDGKLREFKEKLELLADNEQTFRFHTTAADEAKRDSEAEVEAGLWSQATRFWSSHMKNNNPRSRSSEHFNFSYGATEERRRAGSDSEETPKSHTITVSHLKQMENRSNSVLLLYRHCLQLLAYRAVNRKGFEKIMKKFDKYAVENESDKQRVAQMDKVDQNPFVRRLDELNSLVRRTEELFLKISVSRSIDSKISRNLLKTVEKDVEFNVDHEADENQFQPSSCSIFHISSDSSHFWILLAIGLFALIWHLPILSEFPRAHSCLCLLGCITVLWTTEAVPYFVSALVIPFAVVLLRILADDSGIPLNAEKASKLAFGSMFSDATILIIASFSLSTAFSKSSYELRIASAIQRLTGHRPYLFLLAYMLLSAGLSFFISNIAAPVLLTSILEPHLRDFQRTNTYARSLLLGLAFASNIGGLMSPISSPENSIVLGYLEERYPLHQIGFSQWLAMSLPFTLISILFIWAYLCIFMLHKSDDCPPVIPTLPIGALPWRKQDFTILATTLITVIMLYSLAYTRQFFGSMSTIALLPVLVYFGTGILTKKDLSLFNWQLILLVGGGNVLGTAIQSSKLLNIVSDFLLPFVSNDSIHLTALAVIALSFLVTSIVSRTVAAIILTPIILTVGSMVHHIHLFVMCLACTINSTMSLPMTSFPNINSLLVADDFGRPFLHASDFVRHGITVSLIVVGLLGSVGYWFIRMAFDKPVGLFDPIESTMTGGTQF